ncbi:MULTISPECIES: ATP-binding protein [Myxococcaceae]|uniref:sensor histidine kinase n=1 Tax=Myxococcaceae TaxID=31 RepID=UPI00188F49F0|nr:HAMP domain-containing histidine kinase [Simulacricoccus sp. 17bor-14]
MERKLSSPSNLSWYLKLRWGGIAAQAVVFFAGDRSLKATLPLGAVLALLALQVASNVAGALWARRARRVPERAVAVFTAFDCAVLTALLFLGGHDARVFAVLYLVNIALAGILATPLWTWVLTGLSVGALAFLFVFDPVNTAEAADPLEWQLREAWIAFGVAAGLLVYFLQRSARMLRAREQEMEAARQRVDRQEKLASLATLAAGAAHELNTPLSTIALVASELERHLRRGEHLDDALSDVELIRAEVGRCQRILSQMAVDAGLGQGEAATPITLADLVGRAASAVEQPQRVQVTLEPLLAGRRLVVPSRPLVQALHGVLNNALQASGELPVAVSARAAGDALQLEVQDAGPGMDPETLARAGEPFYTTKQPGQGMGLGLFLTRSVLEQLGGRLELDSAPGQGTRARLVLPDALLEPAAEPARARS